MRSSKFIIKSIAQKAMAKFGFRCRFHDLKYFEVGFFFIFVEFITNLRAPLQILNRKNKCDVILSYFKQGLDNYSMCLIYLHTTLHRILKYVD